VESDVRILETRSQRKVERDLAIGAVKILRHEVALARRDRDDVPIGVAVMRDLPAGLDTEPGIEAEDDVGPSGVAAIGMRRANEQIGENRRH